MDEASSGRSREAADPFPSDDSFDAVRSLLKEAAQVSRELGQLADEMAAQSDSGRREARRLISALDSATEALRGIDETDGGELPVRALNAPPGSDGARMLARQMLANGAERDAVEESLRTSFGIDDAEAVVEFVVTAYD